MQQLPKPIDAGVVCTLDKVIDKYNLSFLHIKLYSDASSTKQLFCFCSIDTGGY